MGETPSGTNQAAALADSVLRGVFAAASIPAKAFLIQNFPFLAVWPMSSIFNRLFDYLVEIQRRYIAMSSTFLIIDFQTAQERARFQTTISAFREALRRGDLNDPDLLKKGKDVNDAFDKMVRFNGAYSPK